MVIFHRIIINLHVTGYKLSENHGLSFVNPKYVTRSFRLMN